MPLKLQLRRAGNVAVLQCEGPIVSHSEFSGPNPVAYGAAVSQKATVVELGREFQELDAEHAGTALLQLISNKTKPSAARIG